MLTNLNALYECTKKSLKNEQEDGLHVEYKRIVDDPNVIKETNYNKSRHYNK